MSEAFGSRRTFKFDKTRLGERSRFSVVSLVNIATAVNASSFRL